MLIYVKNITDSKVLGAELACLHANKTTYVINNIGGRRVAMCKGCMQARAALKEKGMDIPVEDMILPVTNELRDAA